MEIPSRKEVDAEFEKILKLHECYCFAVANADDEHLRRRITEIGKEHLVSKINAIRYSLEIVTQRKKDELRKKIAELGKY
jgi:hypothetical protein